MIILNNITKPQFLIDEVKARRNISKMAGKARDCNLIFRPHFKTHQSADIAEWFREEGVEKITVSSLTMASFFARHGWNDITIAFPFNIRETEMAASLSEKISINLLISTAEGAEAAINCLKGDSGVYIEIDTGYGRSGIEWDNYDSIDTVIRILTLRENSFFKGFLTHAGNTYQARGKEAVLSLFFESNYRMNILREKYANLSPVISVGDTPGCSLADTFYGVDEIRPGNFVFYDLTQYEIGSCSLDEIAVAVACPIVAATNSRGNAVIYGGGVHLSKESLTLLNGDKIYGMAGEFTPTGWSVNASSSIVTSISQEHGLVSHPINLSEGGIIPVMPVHSCMAADLAQNYRLMDGRVLTNLSEK